MCTIFSPRYCSTNNAEERVKKTKELLRAVIVAAASSTVRDAAGGMQHMYTHTPHHAWLRRDIATGL